MVVDVVIDAPSLVSACVWTKSRPRTYNSSALIPARKEEERDARYIPRPICMRKYVFMCIEKKWVLREKLYSRPRYTKHGVQAES